MARSPNLIVCFHLYGAVQYVDVTCRKRIFWNGGNSLYFSCDRDHNQCLLMQTGRVVVKMAFPPGVRKIYRVKSPASQVLVTTPKKKKRNVSDHDNSSQRDRTGNLLQLNLCTSSKKSSSGHWRSRPVYCKSLGSIHRSYLSAPVDRPRGQSGYGDELAAVLCAVCGGSLSDPGQNQ